MFSTYCFWLQDLVLWHHIQYHSFPDLLSLCLFSLSIYGNMTGRPSGIMYYSGMVTGAFTYCRDHIFIPNRRQYQSLRTGEVILQFFKVEEVNLLSNDFSNFFISQIYSGPHDSSWHSCPYTYLRGFFLLTIAKKQLLYLWREWTNFSVNSIV